MIFKHKQTTSQSYSTFAKRCIKKACLVAALFGVPAAHAQSFYNHLEVTFKVTLGDLTQTGKTVLNGPFPKSGDIYNPDSKPVGVSIKTKSEHPASLDLKLTIIEVPHNGSQALWLGLDGKANILLGLINVASPGVDAQLPRVSSVDLAGPLLIYPCEAATVVSKGLVQHDGVEKTLDYDITFLARPNSKASSSSADATVCSNKTKAEVR